jgi:hypothetical protein
MTTLTEEQRRFLTSRKSRLRHARLGTLVSILYIASLLACAWLNPLWFNPFALGQLREAGQVHHQVLGGMAEALPVVFALFWFAALTAILYWEAIGSQDKKYLEIIDALEVTAEPAPETAEGLKAITD